MLVLDYNRGLMVTRTEEHAITIPPFHAGHLGFVPDSEIHIGLLAPFTARGAHCELLLTPYECGKDLARVTCTMRDKRGVVAKLIDALSRLNINILFLETSSVNYARYHEVNILFDWGTSEYDPHEASTISDQQRYSGYRRNFPTDLYAYVMLFERIVISCLEDLAIDSQTRLPELKIRPVTTPRNLECKKTVRICRTREVARAAERVAGRGSHVAVVLPGDLEKVLRQRLDVGPDESLEYLLISETEDRILRAFFPKPASIRKIIHIGIEHQDRPGALGQLLKVVRVAGFNVITELLRQGKGGSRVWEGLLEYEGKVERKNGVKIYEWAAERLASAAHFMPDVKEDLQRNQFIVCPPLYPKREGNRVELMTLVKTVEDQSSSDLDGAEASYVKEQLVHYKPLEVRSKSKGKLSREAFDADERRNNLSKLERPYEDRKPLGEVYDLVMNGELSRKRPKIFLSYPFSAEDKAKIVERSLREFEFVRYQEGDSKIIVNEVINRIESCDYFIGIWDPERTPKVKGVIEGGDSSLRISAWLPFEYGIAKMARKPSILAHHRRLDKNIWNRISPEIAQPDYDDTKNGSFKRCALPMIRRHCLQEWLPSRLRDVSFDCLAEYH